ncbi:Thsd7a, partial [Symbiodinium microadriaticum]
RLRWNFACRPREERLLGGPSAILAAFLAAFLAAAFSAAAFFTGASVLPFALALALPLGFRVVFGKMLRSLASDCGVGGAVAAASLAGGTVAALSLAAGGDGAVASLTSPSSKARQLLDRLDVVEEMPAGRFMFTMARGNGAITRAFAKQLRARFLGLRPASEDELAGRVAAASFHLRLADNQVLEGVYILVVPYFSPFNRCLYDMMVLGNKRLWLGILLLSKLLWNVAIASTVRSHSKGDTDSREDTALSDEDGAAAVSRRIMRAEKTQEESVEVPAAGLEKTVPFDDVLFNVTVTQPPFAQSSESSQHAGEQQDCRWYDWSPWSYCSKSCGQGWKSRKRTVALQPRHGGLECDGASEALSCRLKGVVLLDSS